MTHTEQPFENFEQENITFAKLVFSGKIKTKIIICAQCKNIFLIEHNNSSIEFEPDCCPFCKHKNKPSEQLFEVGNDESVTNHIESNLLDVPDQVYNNFAEKYYRVMMNPQMQKFNIIACKTCHNRICVLAEDRSKVKFCAFCGDIRDELVCIMNPNDPDSNKIGSSTDAQGSLLGYTGRLFHVKTESFEDNLILTDVDMATMRYRFIKVDTQHVALWIANEDIIELFEFISLPDEPTDEPE